MFSQFRSLLSKLFGPRVATDTSPGKMYSLARHQVLAYDREWVASLAPFPEPSPDAPAWGVVMEMGCPGFTGTLAAFSNAQTILYNSDGQGIPREDNNEQIRQASAKLIAAANKAIPYLKPSASYPLPAPWQALFYVRTDSGKQFVERIPVQIPADAPSGQLVITVGDGATLQESSSAKVFVPRDLSQLVEAINHTKKNDRLYLRLLRPAPGVIIGSNELPNLPPSMVATLNNERSSGGYTALTLSQVYERELPPADFVISGQQVISVTVK